MCDVSKTDGGMALMQEERFNRELGARIRAARGQARLTQEALASAVGLSRGSIANIERGDQAPPTYRLTLIAQALNVDLPTLLPGSDRRASQVDRLRSQLPAPYAQAVTSVRATAAARSKRRSGSRG
jgi:transcriptional regulator with XRE-family HTH domain